MKIKVIKTIGEQLEQALNEIGYENVIQIVPEHCYDGCIMNIIVEDKENNCERE